MGTEDVQVRVLRGVQWSFGEETVNLSAYAYGGSNPSRPTSLKQRPNYTWAGIVGERRVDTSAEVRPFRAYKAAGMRSSGLDRKKHAGFS